MFFKGKKQKGKSISAPKDCGMSQMPNTVLGFSSKQNKTLSLEQDTECDFSIMSITQSLRKKGRMPHLILPSVCTTYSAHL